MTGEVERHKDEDRGVMNGSIKKPSLGIYVFYQRERLTQNDATFPKQNRSQKKVYTKATPLTPDTLHAVRLSLNKLSVTRALTPTVAILRAANTSHTLTLVLALNTSGVPEESPGILCFLHLAARRAGVRLASAVRGAMGAVVLVVCGEDGEGLLATDAGVVAALCGLDCFACFGGCGGC